MFQINRRKPIADLPNRELNRIMKWSAQAFQQVMLSGLGATEPQQIYAAILSVDLNTVPTSGTLSSAEQVSIFTEMSTEADRLSQANGPTALA